MSNECRTSGSSFRATSKHFLTWSATAANQKIQKISKHVVQNVSKFQRKVEKVLHPLQPPLDPSFSTIESPPNLLSSVGILNDNVSTNHDHLMPVSNVNVAVVHNLSVTKDQRIPNKSEFSHWINSSRLRKNVDFEIEKSKVEKRLGEEMDIFELTPLATSCYNTPEVGEFGEKDLAVTRSCTFDLMCSSRSSCNSTSISLGVSSLPTASPHWSGSSSIDSSEISLASKYLTTGPISNERKEIWTNGSSALNIVLGKEGMDQVMEGTDGISSGISSSHLETKGQWHWSNEETGQSELSRIILEKEPELRNAPWFHAGLPREITLEVLKDEVLGSFIVRESTTRLGCFALSIRVPSDFQPTGIAHYLVLKTNKGFKIKGFTKEFGSLHSLITHHSVMPELLPCPLFRPSNHPPRFNRTNSADFMEHEKLLTPMKHRLLNSIVRN